MAHPHSLNLGYGMTGIESLDTLLKSLSPELQVGEFVFCTLNGDLDDYIRLNPIASFNEQEGLTLILPVDIATKADLKFDTVFRQITLTVHSSLNAVGLTAAIADKLTSYGISANVVTAYYHDHIFVPNTKAELALQALNDESLSDRDVARSPITSAANCWVLDAGSPAARVSVTVGFEIGSSGRVLSSGVRLLSADGGTGVAVETAFQAARRAVLRCQGEGYLPPNGIVEEQTVELVFNAETLEVQSLS